MTVLLGRECFVCGDVGHVYEAPVPPSEPMVPAARLAQAECEHIAALKKVEATHTGELGT
jgi:hypothetical protein